MTREQLEQLGAETAATVTEAAEALREIGDIFGLETYSVIATMEDGSERTATLYAETWQAAARQASRMFLGARNITINGRR